MVKNVHNRYAYNSVTTKKNDDGSVAIHFGGDPKVDNYMPNMAGWLYLVRFYRPHQEILDGKWTLPAAVEVKQCNLQTTRDIRRSAVDILFKG